MYACTIVGELSMPYSNIIIIEFDGIVSYKGGISVSSCLSLFVIMTWKRCMPDASTSHSCHNSCWTDCSVLWWTVLFFRLYTRGLYVCKVVDVSNIRLNFDAWFTVWSSIISMQIFTHKIVSTCWEYEVRMCTENSLFICFKMGLNCSDVCQY